MYIIFSYSCLYFTEKGTSLLSETHSSNTKSEFGRRPWLPRDPWTLPSENTRPRSIHAQAAACFMSWIEHSAMNISHQVYSRVLKIDSPLCMSKLFHCLLALVLARFSSHSPSLFRSSPSHREPGTGCQYLALRIRCCRHQGTCSYAWHLHEFSFWFCIFTRKSEIVTVLQQVTTKPGELKKLNDLKDNSVLFGLSKSNLIQTAWKH